MGWAVSLDVILSKGSRQSESQARAPCFAHTSIKVPTPSSARFRGAEITACYNQQSLSPSGLLSHPVYFHPSPLCFGERHWTVFAPLWLHCGSVTQVWQVTLGWEDGSLPAVPRHCHLSPHQCEALIASDWAVRNLVLSHIHQKILGKKQACQSLQSSCLHHCNLCLHQSSFFRLISAKKVQKNTLQLNLQLQIISIDESYDSI